MSKMVALLMKWRRRERVFLCVIAHSGALSRAYPPLAQSGTQ